MSGANPITAVLVGLFNIVKFIVVGIAWGVMSLCVITKNR